MGTWPAPNGGDPNAAHWYSRNPGEPVPAGPGTWSSCVIVLRRAVRRIEQARRTQHLTQTALAVASGVPASTVRDTINGAAWPMFSTLSRIAGAVGLRAQPRLLPSEQRRAARLVARWDPPPPAGWAPPTALTDLWGSYLAQLRWLADAYDIRPVAWARAADLRPATVSELLGPHPTRADARIDTLTTLSLCVGTAPVLQPADQPYLPVWKHADEL